MGMEEGSTATQSILGFTWGRNKELNGGGRGSSSQARQEASVDGL